MLQAERQPNGPKDFVSRQLRAPIHCTLSTVTDNSITHDYLHLLHYVKICMHRRYIDESSRSDAEMWTDVELCHQWVEMVNTAWK